MKKNRIRKFIAPALIIIFLSNIPPIKSIINLVSDGKDYNYSNSDGSFTFSEFKGHDTAMMLRRFNHFKLERQKKNDTLYRIFWRNPLKFWRWGEYVYDGRYKFPYKNWKEIRKKRVIEDLKHYQDF